VCHDVLQVRHTQRANMTAYLEVPFAVLLQGVLFGDPINALTMFGSVLIVGSGIAAIWIAGQQSRSKSGSNGKRRASSGGGGSVNGSVNGEDV
jgi:hypothetical protein